MRRFPLAATAALLTLSGCNGSDLPPAYRDLEVPVELLASAGARSRGRALYLTNCALCHGERGDGHGRRRNLSSRPRDFTDPRWQRRTSPHDWIAAQTPSSSRSRLRSGRSGSNGAALTNL